MLGGYKERLPVDAATVDGSEKGFFWYEDPFSDGAFRRLPTGPSLGVTYDWEYIESRGTGKRVLRRR